MQPCEQTEVIKEIKGIVQEHRDRLTLGDNTLSNISNTLTRMEKNQAAFQEDVKKNQEEFKKAHHEMHKRMFVDNGRKSFQTSLSSLALHAKIQWSFVGAIIVSILGMAIRLWLTR